MWAVASHRGRTIATAQAPHSPSAQPSLAPVSPRARSNSSSVVWAENPSAQIACPFKTNSTEEDAIWPASPQGAIDGIVAATGQGPLLGQIRSLQARSN